MHHFALLTVVSGIGCLLFFRLYSTLSSRRGVPLSSARRRLRSSPRRRRGGRVTTPRAESTHTKTQAAEFFAGGPYRWYGAAGATSTASSPSTSSSSLPTSTRCKHHNILVVNRVDYTGLDLLRPRRRGGGRELRVRNGDEPRACDAGAQSLRPLRWARKGPPFRAPRPGSATPGGVRSSHGGFQFFFKRTKRDNEGETG